MRFFFYLFSLYDQEENNLFFCHFNLTSKKQDIQIIDYGNWSHRRMILSVYTFTHLAAIEYIYDSMTYRTICIFEKRTFKNI